MRRTDSALLPAVDVGHVLAGEQERAVATQQRAEVLRPRVLAPFRPGCPAVRDVLPGHRYTVGQVLPVVLMQAFAVRQGMLQALRRRHGGEFVADVQGPDVGADQDALLPVDAGRWIPDL